MSEESEKRSGGSKLSSGGVSSAEMFSRVYAELKQMAAAKLSHEHQVDSINPTVLVHDAYLRLSKDDQKWQDRRYFFAAAAESMRRILVERARARKRIKRGGDWQRQEFRESQILSPVPDDELLAIDEALAKLECVDPESAELVKMRYFIGMNQEEIAASTGVSVRTVKRQWSYAKAWLRTEIAKLP